MEGINNYPNLIRQALTQYRELLTNNPKPSYEVIQSFDDENKQYIIRKLGWEKSSRIKQVVLHVALRNKKIWIEEDWTEDGVATYFLEHGVPNDDIVLGFQPPIMRPYTEFALA